MKHKHLVHIFLGESRPHNIPTEIWYIIFHTAGLCEYGRRHSYFQIFFRPTVKWHGRSTRVGIERSVVAVRRRRPEEKENGWPP